MRSMNINNCPIYPCNIPRLGGINCDNLWDCSSCKMPEKQKIKDLTRNYVHLMVEMESRNERT